MTGARVGAFLAGRSLLRGNRGVAVTTTLMLLLIYISLLFLPSLIQGAVVRVQDQLVDTLTSDVVVTPDGVMMLCRSFPRPRGLYREALAPEKIAEVPVIERLLRQGA